MDRAKAIAREISWLVPKLLRGLRAGFISNEQLSTSQLVILMRIHEQKIARAGILSREMHVSASTITGLIDRLVRSGYLKRTHDEKDRRVINVGLTQKGKTTIETVLAEVHNRWYKILSQLTEEERESYLRILKRIVEVLAIKNA